MVSVEKYTVSRIVSYIVTPAKAVYPEIPNTLNIIFPTEVGIREVADIASVTNARFL